MSERLKKKKLAQKETNRLKKLMIEKVLSGSRASNSAFNLNLLVDGWLELESDPGTFSLLIEDFGCLGAQVDEVYDLEQKFEGPVLGFIFLFKWLNNQQNDRFRNQKSTSNNNNSLDNDREKSSEEGQWSYVKDESTISEMFFAKQMISNSCATHALISILLNCDYDKLDLGPILTRLKEHTQVMNPENKGYAIGNLPELAKAHNSHASYSSLYTRSKTSSHSGMSYMISGNQRTNLQQQNKHEAYHFVSYVPINNRLYELDGLKNYPIDHGPIERGQDWTEKFRSVIKERLLANKTGDSTSISNDIRYNLMVVVPDKRVSFKSKIVELKYQQKIVRDTMTPLTADEILSPPYSPLSNSTETASESGSTCNSPTRDLDTFTIADKHFFIKFDKHVTLPEEVSTNSIENPKDVAALSYNLSREVERLESLLREEIDKRRKYKIENSRRTHNYEPFIMTFLSMLAKHGKLADLIEKDLGIPTEQPAPPTPKATKPLKKNGKKHTPPAAEPKPQKPKYKYVSTGRPVGRPRKYPLVPPPVETTNSK